VCFRNIVSLCPDADSSNASAEAMKTEQNRMLNKDAACEIRIELSLEHDLCK
jgi:hypothetical protein